MHTGRIKIMIKLYRFHKNFFQAPEYNLLLQHKLL